MTPRLTILILLCACGCKLNKASIETGEPLLVPLNSSAPMPQDATNTVAALPMAKAVNAQQPAPQLLAAPLAVPVNLPINFPGNPPWSVLVAPSLAGPWTVCVSNITNSTMPTVPGYASASFYRTAGN